MDVSVLILTYNRKEKLKNLLDSLSLQSFMDFEVIVWVNNSTDGTVDFLDRCKYPFPLETIVSKENLGRAGGRNALAKHANCPTLIFFDDDLELSIKCIETHREHHQNYLNSILNCGQLTNPEATRNDMARYRVWIERQWHEGFTEGTVQVTKEKFLFTSANLSLPCQIFNDLGGFNSVLTDSEDEDLAKRALKNGIKIYYNHLGYAWHNDTTSITAYTKRQREYLNSKRQNPSMGFSAVLDKKLVWWKQIVYSLISQRLFLSLVDSFNIFLIIPRKFRYKFYSALIWSFAALYPEKKI